MFSVTGFGPLPETGRELISTGRNATFVIDTVKAGPRARHYADQEIRIPLGIRFKRIREQGGGGGREERPIKGRTVAATGLARMAARSSANPCTNVCECTK